MDSRSLLRVFWPTEIVTYKSTGLLIGWRNSEMDVFVVGILESHNSKGVDHALRNGSLFRRSQRSVARIFQLCGRSRMHVLGSLNGPPTKLFDPRHIVAFTNVNSRVPEIYCPRGSGISIQVILFDKPSPKRMQYVSLHPISLALDNEVATPRENLDVIPGTASNANVQLLIENVKRHSVKRYALTIKEQSLDIIVGQVNCAYEISTLLSESSSFMRLRSKRSLSISERVVKSATSLWDEALAYSWRLLKIILPYLLKTVLCVLVAQRAAAELVLTVVEWRIKPDFAALKDVSATAQQCDIRLQQLCYWPTQYLKLRKRKDDWESVTTTHPDYIRFFNSLWLVANDVIIGIAIGSYLLEKENSLYVATCIDTLLREYTIHGLHDLISWLQGKPAGLKLNQDLAVFLGDLFIWVIDYWEGCISRLGWYLPHVVRAIGFSSFAGASMPISLFSDLLSILTLHIYSFYIASARIYNWQLTTIVSLFHLFRGKKRNVLRNRIDSCDYELDQLLVGAIFFTLLFFLLPTVLVYYLTFACGRMIIIAIKAFLETMLACLNHFPLFALMLRLKDSKRLPGGIVFHLVPLLMSLESELPNEAPMVSYIYMKSIPLSFAAIFYQYFQLGNRIRKHYVSLQVIQCLATGRFVPPIHRKSLYSLQYSMLPTHRGNILDIWYRLTEPPGMKIKGRKCPT